MEERETVMRFGSSVGVEGYDDVAAEENGWMKGLCRDEFVRCVGIFLDFSSFYSRVRVTGHV